MYLRPWRSRSPCPVSTISKILLSQLPGGGGEIGTILDSSGLAVDGALCAVGGVETLGLSCLLAVVDIFRLVFDLFFANIFVGRPKVGKDSATDAAALFLIPSANPVVALWGMGIRNLEAIGCFLSGAGPCAQAFTNLASAALFDLQKQFGGQVGMAYFQQYAQLLKLQNPDSSKTAIAARSAIDAHYPDAVKRGLINPQTGFAIDACAPGMRLVGQVCRPCAYDPTVNPCPTPPKIKCPPGSQFDPKTEQCLQPQPPPPPQICPPGTTGRYPVCVPTGGKPVPPSGCNCV